MIWPTLDGDVEKILAIELVQVFEGPLTRAEVGERLGTSSDAVAGAIWRSGLSAAKRKAEKKKRSQRRQGIKPQPKTAEPEDEGPTASDELRRVELPPTDWEPPE